MRKFPLLFVLLGGLSLLLGSAGWLSEAVPARVQAQTESAVLTLSPATVIPNQTMVVTGANFTWGNDVIIEALTLDGIQLPASKVSSGTLVNVDSGGSFVATVVIPVNSDTLTPGSHTLTAVDSESRQASASFTVSTPTVSISPTSSSVGSTVTVTGANFPADSSRIGADPVPQVDIEYRVVGGVTRKVASAQTDVNGGFTVTFEVPLKTPIPSTGNEVRAVIPTTGFTAIATHEVPDSELTVSPSSGSPGTQVTVSGTSYKAFVPISSVRISGIPVLTEENLHTDGDGSLSVSFVVPTLENGTYPIMVQAGRTSRIATFTVSDGTEPEADDPPAASGPPPTSWVPLRYSAAKNLEPLSDNLVRVFYFDNATKEWSFYDPQPEFAEAATLTELVQNQGYWVRVRWDQTLVLGGKNRTFYRGWNLIAW